MDNNEIIGTQEMGNKFEELTVMLAASILLAADSELSPADAVNDVLQLRLHVHKAREAGNNNFQRGGAADIFRCF